MHKTSKVHPIRRMFDRVNDLQRRERQRLLEEVLKVRDLMPLLMKQRNGYRWTAEDRQEIRMRLRVLAGLVPYVIPLVMPGGFFLLPVLAWWLDRRKRKPGPEKAGESNNRRAGA